MAIKTTQYSNTNMKIFNMYLLIKKGLLYI